MPILPTYNPDPATGIMHSRKGEPITLTVHDAFNEVSEEMERTLFANFEDGMAVSIYSSEVEWTPCDCGWQYPDPILRQASGLFITLDSNPTHRCTS